VPTTNYDLELLARMFALGDTRFVREGARCYQTNRELDELAESGEVPHDQAKALLSRINGYAVVQHSTYYPIELDNRYTMPGEDEPRSAPGPGFTRVLSYRTVETPLPSVTPVGSSLTDTDSDVTDALTLLDRPHQGARWVELYKVLEIIESDGKIAAVREAAGVPRRSSDCSRKPQTINAPAVWTPPVTPARTRNLRSSR
jgi:hypothetical protein